MSSEWDEGVFEAEIAAALQREYAHARQQARVPPPEVVWLHATMRAREEAARRAARPIVIAQSVGAAAFAGLLVSLVGRLPPSQVSQIPLVLIEVILGSWLVLAPVALYLAFSRD